MPDYRRCRAAGGTYFFTLVTFRRNSWLCESWARVALRQAIETTRQRWPFEIDAWVLLPDHLHCIWTLPEGDDNYQIRWRLIKQRVSRMIGSRLEPPDLPLSRQKRGERGVWQRRFWEHLIRDESDFARHCDYIHYNPVKHGLCDRPGDWPWSTFHRFVQQGKYAMDWGVVKASVLDDGIGRE